MYSEEIVYGNSLLVEQMNPFTYELMDTNNVFNFKEGDVFTLTYKGRKIRTEIHTPGGHIIAVDISVTGISVSSYAFALGQYSTGDRGEGANAYDGKVYGGIDD